MPRHASSPSWAAGSDRFRCRVGRRLPRRAAQTEEPSVDEIADARRAVAAATASDLGLAVEDGVVLNDSNRLVARMLPCNIVARVSLMGWFAAKEVELARRLADETDDGPGGGLDPGVEPRLHNRVCF